MDTVKKYQCNETNVMHFSFILLRIMGLFMFRALLAHPQEVYTSSDSATVPPPTDIIHTQYTNRCLCRPPEDEQVMLETCRGPWFSIKWMKSASHWFHNTDVLWGKVSKTLCSKICSIYHKILNKNKYKEWWQSRTLTWQWKGFSCHLNPLMPNDL
jgi:hypothetical protein